MIKSVNISDILFIDIETVPEFASYKQLSDYEKELWFDKRGKNKQEQETIEDNYFNNAGILAEFGKIICISVGSVLKNGLFNQLESKSFYGNDEPTLLTQFCAYINQQTQQNNKLILCGHNIKEFDIPYISRRLYINEIALPIIIAQLQDKKPWETGLLDTMDLWKFGDYKNYISLKLLAHCLKVPSPKDDISGKDVAKVYWKENNLERIKTYCEKDVQTVANIILKFKGLSLLS